MWGWQDWMTHSDLILLFSDNSSPSLYPIINLTFRMLMQWSSTRHLSELSTFIKTPLFAAALTRPYCCLLKVWGERIFYGHKMDIYISCLMSSLAHSSKPPPTGTFQTLFEHKLIKYQHSWGLKFLCRNSISIWAQQFNWWERISIK